MQAKKFSKTILLQCSYMNIVKILVTHSYILQHTCLSNQHSLQQSDLQKRKIPNTLNTLILTNQIQPSWPCCRCPEPHGRISRAAAAAALYGLDASLSAQVASNTHNTESVNSQNPALMAVVPTQVSHGGLRRQHLER